MLNGIACRCLTFYHQNRKRIWKLRKENPFVSPTLTKSTATVKVLQTASVHEDIRI
jgi:hypothetical protein